MGNNMLLKEASSLGYPLFGIQETDANKALTNVAASKDMRLWEGFPVMLATAAGKGLFDLKLCFKHLKTKESRSLFLSLVAVSLALYEYVQALFPWNPAIFRLLPTKNQKEKASFLNNFKKGGSLFVGKKELSVERLTTAFRNYFVSPQNRLNELLAKREEFNLEYALSQVFSVKQKELFLKKLQGEKLTKTESEYFSRAVKKKVLALANPELHRLAQELLR